LSQFLNMPGKETFPVFVMIIKMNILDYTVQLILE